MKRFLLAIAFLTYISLGLPDTLIGVAWPSVRGDFSLSQTAMGIVLIFTSLGYFISSSSVGGLMRRIPIGILLAASSGLVAMAEFGFAISPAWWFFVLAAVIHGLGSGAIDAGINHFAAIRFSARQMNWLHACYSLGAMLGPVIMTSVLVASGSWRTGYVVVGTLLALLAITFLVTAKTWNEEQDAGAKEAAANVATSVSWRKALASRPVWLQIFLFFFYTGIEVGVGQWSFTLLKESRGLSVEAAGFWVTCYWASIFVGRVFSGFIVEKVGIDRLLRVGLFGVVVGAIVFATTPIGWLSLLALPLMGLCIAPVYPCMMTRTPQRLGKAISMHAVGFQVSAAMIGASSLPALSGLLIAKFGLEVLGPIIVFFTVCVFSMHELLLRSDRQTSKS